MAVLGVCLLVAGSLTSWWWLTRAIPPLDGRMPLVGLAAPVEVRFDRFAVPHVFAGSDTDAWRAIGYLQGRDRQWQMELYRRAASGRLSEILGEATISIDRRFLTLGLRRAAEAEWAKSTGRVRDALESFAAGVNAAMTSPRPLEHQLLGLRPEPWSPVDSLAIGKLFAWRLGENHTAELLRYQLVDAMGNRALDLFPPPPDWAPVILGNPGATGTSGASGARGARGGGAAGGSGATSAAGAIDDGRWTIDDHRSPIAGLEWLSSDSRAMSNSWVISGARTASGRPILANDPHLAIEMPSVWWEVHVNAGELNVAGVTIPGIPFVIIGHNERIGWGVTNVGADVQDFFVEEIDAEQKRYKQGPDWLPLGVVGHQLPVRGRERPLEFVVHSTPRGPVLPASEWWDPHPDDAETPPDVHGGFLSLKWEIDRGESAAAFDLLSRARNWQEFTDAVRRFSAPSQNFVYADIDGNIGYAMSGLLPIRGDEGPRVRVPGTSDDWRGFHDVTELPTVLNPASGQIVTANNEVDRTLPYSITSDWVAPFRAQRILELLGDRRGLDVQAMRNIQDDIKSLSADRILGAIDLPASLESLRAWDRRVDARPEAMLFEAFEEALWRRTFADEMPSGLYDRFYRYAGNERFAGLHAVIADERSPWFDNRSTPNVRESRSDVIRHAADDALTMLRGRYGEPSSWRWDTAHAVKFSHALAGGGQVLDWFFSRGPFPTTGDSMTVSKTTTNLRQPYATSEGASFRQILLVGTWDESLGINTTGQSGHQLSPHYFDQNVMWRQREYRSLPFTRRAVEAATVSRLELVPRN